MENEGGIENKEKTENVKNNAFVIKKTHAIAVASVVAILFGAMLFVSLSLLSSANARNLVLEREISVQNQKASLSMNAGDQEPANAEEIYKMFICSCCGRTIDAKCCGMAREMVSFVDEQVDAGLSKMDVILGTVKKYGLPSLVESMQDEIKVELLARAPENRPKIAVEPESYDFGEVSLADGFAFTQFTIRNVGESALIIDGISTSCGCTMASLGGSPFYGMSGHGGQGASPPGWTHEIPPGGTVGMTVRYNPGMHPDFRGDATRMVYITSDDPVDFRKGVRIELKQVD
jgi:cytochrome c-type biogenesis protein CcmH/NrfF